MQWFKDEISITANEASYTIIDATSGVYYCEVTDPLVPDLIIRSANHTVLVGGIGVDKDLMSNLIIYPNPATNFITIKTKDNTEINTGTFENGLIKINNFKNT